MKVSKIPSSRIQGPHLGCPTLEGCEPAPERGRHPKPATCPSEGILAGPFFWSPCSLPWTGQVEGFSARWGARRFGAAGRGLVGLRGWGRNDNITVHSDGPSDDAHQRRFAALVSGCSGHQQCKAAAGGFAIRKHAQTCFATGKAWCTAKLLARKRISTTDEEENCLLASPEGCVAAVKV